VNRSKLVLYADDDIDDKTWVAEAGVSSSFEIKFVENGKEVLRFLSSSGFAPSLIVLDLNMPELDGRQTLKTIRADPSYHHIPVAIVTTSSSKIDRDVCKKLGADLFLTKPNSYAEWKDIIRMLESFLDNRGKNI
jgi:CheY-like chemotaxis protein